MDNLTPCKIVTPENFILKLGTRDYVEDVTYYNICDVDVDRISGSFSPNRWNITLFITFAICYRPSVYRLSVVCRLQRSCALLRRFKFSAIFLRHWVPRPSVDIHWKFHGDRPKRTPPPGELNTRRVAKYNDFRPIDVYISKRCKIGIKLILITNRKSYMSLRLVPKSVTLNDLERRNGVVLRYFSEFASFRRALRKSSRSLSHQLMSSCFYSACNACIASAVLATAIPSVRLSVCPSHAGIVSKRRHVARCSLHRWIAKCV